MDKISLEILQFIFLSEGLPGLAHKKLLTQKVLGVMRLWHVSLNTQARQPVTLVSFQVWTSESLPASQAV